MSLAVLTTVFPKAEPFLDDFQQSLAEQDDQGFVLYVLDDQLGDVATRFAHFAGRLRVVPARGRPSAIRTQGIRALARDGITAVVFADSDDCLSRNRVSVSRSLLRQHTVVVNELLAFGAGIDGSVPMLGSLLREGQILGLDDIIHGNVFGLSNTACLVEALMPHVGLIDDTLLAYDWALYTRLLCTGVRGVFTTSASTAYRQHADTIAGLQGRDQGTLVRCVRVKARHYQALIDLGCPFPGLSKAFNGLSIELEQDPGAQARYAAYCAAKGVQTQAWWSAAAVPYEQAS